MKIRHPPATTTSPEHYRFWGEAAIQLETSVQLPGGLPLYSHPVPAGFPSPADDHIEDHPDLERLLVRHPAATFFLRARSEALHGDGILSGDIVVVDRSLKARHDTLIVAAFQGEMLLRRLYWKDGHTALLSSHPGFSAIQIPRIASLEIWGVVTGILRVL